MVTASSQSANVARSCTADSGDGQRWQEASYTATRYRLSDVAWSGERFVAVGGLRDESAIVYSSDGNRWQRARDRAISKGLDAVVWNGERFVAVGYDGSIVYSRDGDRWETATDSATAEALRDIVWNGTRFVAVGHHGVIVHSTDGDRWKPASRPAVPLRARAKDDPHRVFYYFGGIAWNGERFVAVGWGGNERVGTVVHSRDGDRWELAKDHDHPAGVHFQAIASSGRRFVAVNYGTTRYSTDGDHWEAAANTATVDTLRDVAWGHGRFGAVGWNGTIVTSP